jgi:hypothetical protein
MRCSAHLETSCCSAATRMSRREPDSASAKGQITPSSTSTFEGNVVHSTIHGGCGGSIGALKDFVMILLSRSRAASSSRELACRLLTWAASLAKQWDMTVERVRVREGSWLKLARGDAHLMFLLLVSCLSARHFLQKNA